MNIFSFHKCKRVLRCNCTTASPSFSYASKTFRKKMATPARAATRQVTPLLSLDRFEAKRRVLNLYRSWYRQIPYIMMEYDIPKTEDDVKRKIREEFMRHKDVKDIRVIDMLVIKGQMELKETSELWKNKGNLMYWFKDTVEKKPTDFMSKFLAGHD